MLPFLWLIAQAVPAFVGSGQATQTIPSPAAMAGYTLRTFSSQFYSSEFDVNQTCNAGLNWYFPNFYGFPVPAYDTLAFLSPGVSVGGGTGTPLSSIASACANGATWHGTAWGGGFYIRALLSWSHAQVIAANKSGGWPSFWSQPIEHATNSSGPQWPGQSPTYAHFAELDHMEDDVWVGNPTGLGMTTHEWWGIDGTTCTMPAGEFCQISNMTGGGSAFENNIVTSPPSVTTPHWYGALVIPATGSTNGSVTYYLDDVATGASVSYTQFTTQGPPPSASTPWAFGVVDQLHWIAQFSTGNNQPLEALAIEVWQSTTTGNITQ